MNRLFVVCYQKAKAPTQAENMSMLMLLSLFRLEQDGFAMKILVPFCPPFALSKLLKTERERNRYRQAAWDTNNRMKHKRGSEGADYVRPSQISW